MENKIKLKRVGDVNIFEIFGELMGAFALRGKEAMHQSMSVNKRKNVLYNVQELRQIDDTGVEALLENASEVQKSGILTGHCPIIPYIQSRDTMKKLQLLKDEMEAARFFGREFAAPSLEEQIYPERRQFVRLKTVLPLHFWYQTKDDEKLEFFAVVTNLSEGGLFAQFIESVSEDTVKRTLNPYDLKFLNLKMGLIGQRPLTASGKVIHGNLAEGGIGIEFYEMADVDKFYLRDWIAQHLIDEK